MSLDLRDCKFHGHALPEPFAAGDLESVLAGEKLLPKSTGLEAKALETFWEVYCRKLRALGDTAGAVRVRTHVVEPLIGQLGYARLRPDDDVLTREGLERGGAVLETEDEKRKLRVWTIDSGADFDAPQRRGQAYRYSPTQIAQRVLLAKGERLGLLTDGTELRILFCDPARRESHIAVELGRAGGWRGAKVVPDSFRLLLALGRPDGVEKVPGIVEQARLQQTRVTDTLREQARLAVRDFVQALLDEPRNEAFFDRYPDKQDLAKRLFKDALVIVYRLLFILKLEASSDPERSFSFASTSLWRNTYSPSHMLAKVVKAHMEGGDTGAVVSEGLRMLFRMFREGFSWSEVKVTRLGGMLFGEGTAPLLDDSELFWSEAAAVKLLDQLLWTPRGRKGERQRVHYGPLYVEDLGRVYEALLELSPGIATEPMCRLRRQKLEVVVPAAQGEAYRQNAAPAGATVPEKDEEEESAEAATDEEEKPSRGKTRVEWRETIPEGHFYLRVGLGRKASGSYYTPQAFVKFLIQETVGPQVEARSPRDDPDPTAILGLKVLDPAMGSGHFLVEACRTLGDALYEACRACDARAEETERRANGADTEEQRAKFQAESAMWRRRVVDLPDPNDELVAYLPSRAAGGEADVRSQSKALAICRRLVAVHCLYGVDKNPLAVELAKLSLWLESYAEGLPLTFLDHRLLCGDSLTGPFFEKLLTLPSKDGEALADLYSLRVSDRLTAALGRALVHVRDLESSIGKDEADIIHKRSAKEKLDAALEPFKKLAAAWSGAVMLGESLDDDYRALAKVVGEGGDVAGVTAARPGIARAIEVGKEGVSYDLVFPEVFWPEGRFTKEGRAGFHSVVGNPPWDAIQFKSKEFLAAFDLAILEAPTVRERDEVEKRLLCDSAVAERYREGVEEFERIKRANDAMYEFQKATIDGDLAGRQLDLYRVFMERNVQLLAARIGWVGVVVPAAFHANAGATAVRKLYMDGIRTTCCFSFENRAKIFEIDSRFKFAVLVATSDERASRETRCAFYLHDVEWVFERQGQLTYSADFIRATGGEYYTLLELRDPIQAAALQRMWSAGVLMSGVLVKLGITPNTSELPMLGSEVFMNAPPGGDVRTPSVAKTLLLASRRVALHEGKTFHQFDDLWGESPRYVVRLEGLRDRPRWLQLLRYYRFAYRAISASTNERTGIAALLPPPTVSTRKAASDITAGGHANSGSLQMLSLFNSFSFDYALRAMVQTDVGLFIVKRTPVPPSALAFPRSLFLAHSALRLTCNHEGYFSLWQEQLGQDIWREPVAREKHAWPVLAGDDARWAVRSAIDAVVAEAYGLSRDQYVHLLASFTHKSYPKAPALCLAAFDELASLGLETFTRKHDPYWDIPLVETLPKPVIDLPGAVPSAPPGSPTSAPPEPEKGQLALLAGEAPRKRGRKKGA